LRRVRRQRLISVLLLILRIMTLIRVKMGSLKAMEIWKLEYSEMMMKYRKTSLTLTITTV